MTIQDRAVIAGIAQSEFGRGLAATEYELASQVIVAACRDAGVDPGEIDGACLRYTIETSDEVAIAKTVGMDELRFFARLPFGGGAGPACVAMLAMAVASGQCSVGVAFRSRKRASKQSRSWIRHGRTGDVAVGEEFSRPYGLVLTGRRGRDVGSPLHARIRCDSRPSGQCRTRLSPARQRQP